MFGISELRTEVARLRSDISGLRQTAQRLEERIDRRVEAADDAEKLAYRRLIRDLLGGKPNVDRFLDVLGDHAHLFEDGPLQGDIVTLHEQAGKPHPGDLGPDDASLGAGGTEP